MRSAWLVLSLVLASCPADSGLQRRCAFDSDCAEHFTCDSASGTCRCLGDFACEADAFCNGRSCQKRVGCDTSFDCPEGFICDRTSGNCIERARCTDDVQCRLGEVCDGLRFQCVGGCREHGDCPLGHVCRCPAGQSCGVGFCEDHGCEDDSYCRYGERCIPDDEGTPRCVRDERGPYCLGCQYVPGSFARCGDGPNFCLLDRKVDWRQTYCGVDCSQDQPCPWGYECRNILRLTQSLCQTDAQCPAVGEACSDDRDCPGARCDRAAGRCAGTCSYNEDSKIGYCTCTTDDECPQDQCDPVTFRCAIGRQPCTPEGGECDRRIYCVNLGNRAACLIGKNCVPAEGLTCAMTLGDR